MTTAAAGNQPSTRKCCRTKRCASSQPHLRLSLVAPAPTPFTVSPRAHSPRLQLRDDGRPVLIPLLRQRLAPAISDVQPIIICHHEPSRSILTVADSWLRRVSSRPFPRLQFIHCRPVRPVRIRCNRVAIAIRTAVAGHHHHHRSFKLLHHHHSAPLWSPPPHFLRLLQSHRPPMLRRRCP